MVERLEEVCSRCVMDTTVADISFDHRGCCNYCIAADTRLNEETYSNDPKNLNKLVKKIKKSGKNKEYDCVIGISGGVDSSYVAYLVKDLGLRPLAVHLDNGWNTDLSISNINSLLDSLNIDLYTHVIDWEEFKDLQVAFLRSSIANAEIPTDHAIGALLFNSAIKHNIKYVLHGGNIATESIMPAKWMESAFDLKLLKKIHKKYGKKKLSTYPVMGLLRMAYNTFFRRIKYIGILNYVDYDKEAAISLLENKFNWKRYEAKHFESIFTRWFQGFFLPTKFNMDKRKAHYSSLIMAKQMTRLEALDKLNEEPLDQVTASEDTDYVMKKLELTKEEMNEILNDIPKNDLDYSNTRKYVGFLNEQLKFAKKVASGR